MEKTLPIAQKLPGQVPILRPLHLPQLPPQNPEHDLLHQLDRAAQQGLQTNIEDERGDAGQRFCYLSTGQGIHDQNSLRPKGAKARL